jgi:SAM-dependent methyltransferase
MGKLTEFVTSLHTQSQRDYVARVVEYSKGECAAIAKKFGQEYWDGPRQYGYGGYSYDGRWKAVAQAMIAKYGLTNQSEVLDIGCGKGYLLYEFTQLLPGIKVKGLDISKYAIENGLDEVKENLVHGHAKELPFAENQFDLVISNTTFHNLFIKDLFTALKEVARVQKEHAWICVESYRNEYEKANLLYWQLTCESFYSPEEWEWIYSECGYNGDFEFIYFE